MSYHGISPSIFQWVCVFNRYTKQLRRIANANANTNVNTNVNANVPMKPAMCIQVVSNSYCNGKCNSNANTLMESKLSSFAVFILLGSLALHNIFLFSIWTFKWDRHYAVMWKWCESLLQALSCFFVKGRNCLDDIKFE